VETNVLVTLVREVELQRMGATQLFTRSKDVGIESVWAPITDKWIPESMRILVDLVELLLTRLREDKVIVVVGFFILRSSSFWCCSRRTLQCVSTATAGKADRGWWW
jgi:hypothetical protein